mmetsp:Transcript_47381/g.111708  ORF Transcript_47381/g.111708 Transcript_47381/m.111708 type:complete len:218 (-) Transcript_47381:498-1151(-)
MPRWYLTSPEPSTSPVVSSDATGPDMNSLKISSIGLRMTLARMLRRPLCGIPNVMLSHPISTALSIMALTPGMVDSTPSRPKRLVTPYLVARKDSKCVAKTRRSYMFRMSDFFHWYLSATSNLLRIQFACSMSGMCMNSTPMVPQYALLSVSTISRSVCGRPSASTPADAAPTAAAPMKKWRSKSASLNPYVRWSRNAGMRPPCIWMLAELISRGSR